MSSLTPPSSHILLNQVHERHAIFEVIKARYIDNRVSHRSKPCILANGGLRLDLLSQENSTLVPLQRFEMGFSCARVCYLDYAKDIPGNRKNSEREFKAELIAVLRSKPQVLHIFELYRTKLVESLRISLDFSRTQTISRSLFSLVFLPASNTLLVSNSSSEYFILGLANTKKKSKLRVKFSLKLVQNENHFFDKKIFKLFDMGQAGMGIIFGDQFSGYKTKFFQVSRGVGGQMGLKEHFQRRCFVDLKTKLKGMSFQEKILDVEVIKDNLVGFLFERGIKLFCLKKQKVLKQIRLEIAEHGRLCSFPAGTPLPTGIFASAYIFIQPRFKTTSKIFKIDFFRKCDEDSKELKRNFKLDLLTEIPTFTDAAIVDFLRSCEDYSNAIDCESHTSEQEPPPPSSCFPDFIVASRIENSLYFKHTANLSKPAQFTKKLVFSNIGLVKRIHQKNNGFMVQSHGKANYKCYHMGVKSSPVHEISNEVFRQMRDFQVLKVQNFPLGNFRKMKFLFAFNFGDLAKCGLYFTATDQTKNNIVETGQQPLVEISEYIPDIANMQLKELMIQDSLDVSGASSFVFDSADLLRILVLAHNVVMVFPDHITLYSLTMESESLFLKKHTDYFIQNEVKIMTWAVLPGCVDGLVVGLSSGELRRLQISEGELREQEKMQSKIVSVLFCIDASDESIFVAYFRNKQIREFAYDLTLKRTFSVAFDNVCDIKFIPKRPSTPTLFIGYSHGYIELIDLHSAKSLELLPLTSSPISIQQSSTTHYLLQSGSELLLFNSANLTFHQVNIKDFRAVQPMFTSPQAQAPLSLSGQETNPSKSLVVSLKNETLSFRMVTLGGLGQAINEEEMAWGVDKQFQLVKMGFFADQIVAVFGDRKFAEKRELGKTAQPFHYDLTDSLNGKIVFYEKESGKKLAESSLIAMYPDDFQMFLHKDQTMLVLSVLKMAPNHSTKLTTALLVYEVKVGLSVSLKLKLEANELLPKCLQFSPKLTCLAFATGNTTLKVVRFISKTYRKEKKKGSFELSLRDMNSENLFCPIKFISFKEDFLLVSDHQRLIYIFDYSSRHSKFFLRGRTITSQLIRSLSWFNSSHVLVTNFTGQCSLYSPNTAFDQETNYHKIVQTQKFTDLNCLDFSEMSQGLVTDAFGGISRAVLVDGKLFTWLRALARALATAVDQVRAARENEDKFSKENVNVFYSQGIADVDLDLKTVFLTGWGAAGKETKEDPQVCLDVSLLVKVFGQQSIINDVLSRVTTQSAKKDIVKVFNVLSTLKKLE